MKLSSFSFILAMFLAIPAFGATKGGYIVKFKSATLQTAQFKTLEATPIFKDRNLYHVKSLKGINKSDIEYSEPNGVVHALGNPSVYEGEPQKEYPNDWNLKKMKSDQANAMGYTGVGVTIAVIDTGVNYNHPALAGKVLVEEGYNFVDNKVDAMDDNGHGTHCSGTIAGDGVGVAPGAKIVPIKFLSASGSGTLADAIKAIDFARSKKVQIMSNSWGGGGYMKSMEEAIQAAQAEGILFVAAAGNNGSDNDRRPSYPASYDVGNVISVAASDVDDKLAYFSNYGLTKVHVAAPGVNVYSSVLGDAYDKYSGTSMATPGLAGVAALVLGNNLLPPETMKACLQASVEDKGYKIASKGHIDAVKALELCH